MEEGKLYIIRCPMAQKVLVTCNLEGNFDRFKRKKNKIHSLIFSEVLNRIKTVRKEIYTQENQTYILNAT